MKKNEEEVEEIDSSDIKEKFKPIVKKSYETSLASLRGAAPVASPIALVGGIVSDVLTPLGAFAPWLTVLLLTSTMFVGYVWFFKRRKKLQASLEEQNADPDQIRKALLNNSWCKSLGFLCITTTVMFLTMIFQLFTDSEGKGALASNVAVLSELQGRLLDIDEGIENIKETTKEIQKSQADVKKDTEKILEGVGKVVGQVDQISEEMREIKGLAGLIADPKTFAELAHNLKVNFQNENYREALILSDQLAAKGHDFHDLHKVHELLLERSGESDEERKKYFLQNYPNENGRKYHLLQLAFSRMKPIREKHRFSTSSVASISKDYFDAIEPFEELLETYPDDIFIHFAIVGFSKWILESYWKDLKIPASLWSYSYLKNATLHSSPTDFSDIVMRDATRQHEGLLKIQSYFRERLKITRLAVSHEERIRTRFVDATPLKTRFYWSDFDPVNDYKFFPIWARINGWSGKFEKWQKSYGYSAEIDKRPFMDEITNLHEIREDIRSYWLSGDFRVLSVIPSEEYNLVREWRKIFQSGNIFVGSLSPGMPAVESGLEEGDQLISIDGRKLESFGQLGARLNEVGKNQPASLTVRKNWGKGLEQTIEVLPVEKEIEINGSRIVRKLFGFQAEFFMPYKQWATMTGKQKLKEIEALLPLMKKKLGELESKIRGGGDEREFFGLVVEGMTEQVAESFGFERGYNYSKGALVVQVLPGYGAEAGILKNDIITKVNGMDVLNFVTHLLPLETRISPGTKVKFEIFRNRKATNLSGPILMGERKQSSQENGNDSTDVTQSSGVKGVTRTFTIEDKYGSLSVEFNSDSKPTYIIRAKGMSSVGGYRPGQTVSSKFNDTKYGPSGHWQNRMREMDRYALLNAIAKNELESQKIRKLSGMSLTDQEGLLSVEIEKFGMGEPLVKTEIAWPSTYEDTVKQGKHLYYLGLKVTNMGFDRDLNAFANHFLLESEDGFQIKAVGGKHSTGSKLGKGKSNRINLFFAFDKDFKPAQLAYKHITKGDILFTRKLTKLFDVRPL